MPVKRLIIVAVAALGLSFSGYAVSAGSVAQIGANQSTAVAKSASTVILVKGGRGGRGGHSAGGRGGHSAGGRGHGSAGHRSMTGRGGRGFRGYGRRRHAGWFNGYDCDIVIPSPFCWY